MPSGWGYGAVWNQVKNIADRPGLASSGLNKARKANNYFRGGVGATRNIKAGRRRSAALGIGAGVGLGMYAGLPGPQRASGASVRNPRSSGGYA